MRAKRTDANQREIVNELRKFGASVGILSGVGDGFPDLVVGLLGRNFLFEVKDGKKVPSAQKLTPLEDKFFSEWKGQVCIIRSAEEALDFLVHQHNI